MLMHAIAHGRCTDTVRESAPKVDSGRKDLGHKSSQADTHSVKRKASGFREVIDGIVLYINCDVLSYAAFKSYLISRTALKSFAKCS